MTYIVISVLMIIVGIIGIVKNKMPKYEEGLGYLTEIKYYLLFYFLVIVGVIFLAIEIFG